MNDQLESVCVFCGSRPGGMPAYTETAARMGRALAGRGLRLVYGGGRTGMMGVMADAALEAGGEVTGIIPEALMDREVGHEGITDLQVVESMHARKQAMADEADAFIAMPGGLGTFEELFETWTWAQLGYHRKALAVLNIEGYFDPLVEMVQHAVDEGFVGQSDHDMLIVGESPEEILGAFETFVPPKVTKWIDRDET